MKFLWAAFFYCMLCSCTSVGFTEKTVPVPGHAWSASFKPRFEFSITDTLSRYRIFVVLRHTDAYRYKNLWVRLTAQVPGEPPAADRRNLVLATDEQGWLGKGMDDLFEHRILLNATPAAFRKKGTYTYQLEQLMREDPLAHVMNVGIRIEKVTE